MCEKVGASIELDSSEVDWAGGGGVLGAYGWICGEGVYWVHVDRGQDN